MPLSAIAMATHAAMVTDSGTATRPRTDVRRADRESTRADDGQGRRDENPILRRSLCVNAVPRDGCRASTELQAVPPHPAGGGVLATTPRSLRSTGAKTPRRSTDAVAKSRWPCSTRVSAGSTIAPKSWMLPAAALPPRVQDT
mmetsp:Transcript_18744/g.50879  ORF Transcript_18744/g.50879 Transcript_18744/m.50879 type:complete len:143 (+) Transcript_18744:167-595(+)